MKLIKIIIIVFLVFNQTKLYAQIKFEDGTWSEIKQKAKKEKKFIFLDCYTSWCKPCKVMEKEVFSNDTVANFYNQNFINVKYDMEKGIGQALSNKYAINVYPTLLILDYNGLEVTKNIGELKTQKFIEFGKNALQPKIYRTALEAEFKHGNREYSFILSYIENLNIDFSPNEMLLNEYWKTLNNQDITNSNQWYLLKVFVRTTQTLAYETLEKQENDFANIYTKDSVDYVRFNIIRREIMQIVMSNKIKPDKFKPLRTKFNNLKHPNKDTFLFLIDRDFYENNAMWAEYYNLLKKNVEKNVDWGNAKTLNSYAATITKNMLGKSELEYAEKLILRAIELKENQPVFYDTLAQILLKNNKKADALQASEKCLALAKAANEDTSLYEETLAKIKNSK
jgi:thiol-disulfide isomerase/thioredoxin